MLPQLHPTSPSSCGSLDLQESLRHQAGVMWELFCARALPVHSSELSLTWDLVGMLRSHFQLQKTVTPHLPHQNSMNPGTGSHGPSFGFCFGPLKWSFLWRLWISSRFSLLHSFLAVAFPRLQVLDEIYTWVPGASVDIINSTNKLTDSIHKLIHGCALYITQCLLTQSV